MFVAKLGGISNVRYTKPRHWSEVKPLEMAALWRAMNSCYIPMGCSNVTLKPRKPRNCLYHTEKARLSDIYQYSCSTMIIYIHAFLRFYFLPRILNLECQVLVWPSFFKLLKQNGKFYSKCFLEYMMEYTWRDARYCMNKISTCSFKIERNRK